MSSKSAGPWRRRLTRGLFVTLTLAGVGLLSVRLVRGPVVSCEPVRRGALVERVVLSGRVITPGTAQLGFVTLGTVATVLVDAGTHVKAGDILVRLTDEEQQAFLRQAQASLQIALASQGQLREVSDRVADAGLLEARSTLEQALRELERAEKLVASGALSQAALDAEQSRVKTAQSRLDAAEARAAGTKGSEPRIAGARVTEAKAAAALAEARLAQSILVAPSDGTIMERRVEPGDIVQPGKVLLTMARDGELRLETDADERNLGAFHVGLIARVVADGLPEQPFDARLDWIAPSVDVDRGTVTLRFTLPQPPKSLRPEMTVSINLELARHEGALIAPLSAVKDNTSDHPTVMTVEGDRIRSRPVVLGARGIDQVEIVSGVTEGTPLVTQSKLAEGARVRACGGP